MHATALPAGRSLSDPHSQKRRHEDVCHRLRIMVQRNDAARLREDQARPLRRAHERAEAEQLVSLARRNDDRAAKKRSGSVGSSGGLPSAGLPPMHGADHVGGDLASLAGPAVGACVNQQQHLHMQPNAVGLCNGLPCASTMDTGGAAGLQASLCNPVHLDPAYHHGLAHLGTSAPAGSFMDVQGHGHGSAGGSAEWRRGVPANAAAFHGDRGGAMEQFGSMSYQDPIIAPMDMEHTGLHMPPSGLSRSNELHHSDPALMSGAAPVRGMDASQQPHHRPQRRQSFPAAQHPGGGLQLTDCLPSAPHSSVGTPTAAHPVDPGVDGGYNWPLNGVGQTPRASGDFAQFSGRQMPGSLPQTNLEQQHHHGQLAQQQQPGFMPLASSLDDLDPVFMENSTWPSTGSRPDPASGTNVAAMNSLTLSHEQAANASAVPASHSGQGNVPTTYGAQYTNSQPGQSYSHPSVSQSSTYFSSPCNAQTAVQQPPGTGSALHQSANAHSYPATSYPAAGAAGDIASGQSQHSLGMAQQLQGAPTGPNFDIHGTSPAVQLPRPQQQNSHFNFSNTSTLTGRPLPSPGGGFSSGASSATSAGYLDSSVGSRHPVSGMSLQQILQTPSTIPMPDRMPYP